MSLVNKLFKFVIMTSNLYKIDESHSLKHSMDVYNYANTIYNIEVIKKPYLKKHKQIIDICSILHDMCDKKYMNEQEGLENINNFLENKVEKRDINMITHIISTMSYSTVAKNGFPDLKEYTETYHIIRQADILAAYDIDRAVIYGMMAVNKDYKASLEDSLDLFDKRVLQHIYDNTFYHESALKIGQELHKNAETKIILLKKYNL